MPPRKKQRLSRGGDAPVIPPGSLSIHTVCPVLLKVRDTVDAIYDLRHKTGADSKPDMDMCWPVLWGGSFKDICCRFWQDPGVGLGKVLDTCKLCGVLPDTDTVDELGMKFMHLPDPSDVNEESKIRKLSILAFSFADDSFIRGKSCLSGIIACDLLFTSPCKARP